MKNIYLMYYAVFMACNNISTTATSKDSTRTATSETVQTDTSAPKT